MMKRLPLVWLVLLLVFSASAQAQTSVSYRYAYASRGYTDDYFVQLVDPASGETEAVLVPTLEGYQIAYVIPSPDGMWLLAVMHRTEPNRNRPNGSYALRLFSPASGEIRDLVFNDWLFWDIRWSPDSQWLAIILSDPEPSYSLLATYTYHIESATPHYLDSVDKLMYGLSWSPDSSRLLTAGLICEEQYECHRSFFQIFDVPSMALAQSATFGSNGDRTCNFAWSPDNQFIAFRYSCGSGDGMGLAEYFRDLYLWTLESNTIEQITFFTQQVENGTTLIPYSYRYSFVWYDNESLLSSIYGGRFQGGVGYDVAFMQQGATVLHTDGSETRLDRQPLMSWTLNPLYPTEIAYRREDHAVFTDAYNMIVDDISEANIEVATFDGTSLNVLYSGVAGCDLSWSPDGMMLAYSVYDLASVENCSQGLQGLEFVSRETWSSINSYDLADDTVYVVGWLVSGD